MRGSVNGRSAHLVQFGTRRKFPDSVPRVSVLALSVDWNTSTAAGTSATLPGWLSFTRASAERYAPVSAAALAASTFGTDVPVIGQLAGAATRGLLVEPAAVNMFASPTNLTNVAWSGTGTVTAGVTGPDGNASAYHLVTGAGQNGLFQDLGNNTNFLNFQVSAYLKSGLSTTLVAVIYPDLIYFGGSNTLTTSWARYTFSNNAQGQSTNDVIFSRTVTAGLTPPPGINDPEDCYIAFPQAEAGPWPTTFTRTPRAGERPYNFAASAVVFGGTLEIEVGFSSFWGTAQLGQVGDGNKRICTLDGNTFVEIDGVHRQIRATVGGTPVVFPVVLVWNQFDQIVIHIRIGNGFPSGWYSVNGGARISLGAAGALHPYLLTEDAAIDFFCDNTTGTASLQLCATIQYLNVYTRGNTSPFGATYYASPSGGGTGLSRSSTTTLSAAQTLARAYGPGATVLLRAGTYYLANTFALDTRDNGTTYAAYPRDGAVILSGATSVSASWSVDAGSVQKATTTLGAARRLIVNGVLAQIGNHTVTDAASWTINSGAGTITATDATIAGYARPQDVRIQIVSSFTYARVPVVSAAGSVLTMNTAALANALSVNVWLGGAPTVVPDNIKYYDNARELVTTQGDYYFNPSTKVLYYLPRTGDTMSTATVEVATLVHVITVTGSLGAPVTGVRLQGLTVEGADYDDSAGYSSVGSGVNGSFSSPSNYPASTYTVQTGAIEISYGSATLAGCTIRRCGGAGIVVRAGSQGVTVEGCTLSDLAGQGIHFGEVALAYASGSDARVYVTGCTVRRSSFLGCGSWKYGFVDSGAVEINYASACSVDNCTITGTGLTGIALVCPTNPSPSTIRGGIRVTNNLTTNISQGWCSWGVSPDAGTIHTGGPNVPRTTISGNVTTGGPLTIANIFEYIDNSSSGIDSSGNVDAAVDFAWRIQDGAGFVSFDNTVTGNYIGAAMRHIDGLVGVGNVISGNIASTPLDAGALPIIAAAGA